MVMKPVCHCLLFPEHPGFTNSGYNSFPLIQEFVGSPFGDEVAEVIIVTVKATTITSAKDSDFIVTASNMLPPDRS